MTTHDFNQLESAEKNNEIHVSDIVRFVLNNWYWFVASVLIFCATAYLYIGTQPNVYTRTISVMINDKAQGGMNDIAIFDEINMFNNITNVANEQLIFKSKRLMQEVVRRLRLDITYKSKIRLRTTELYKNSPITIHFPDETETQASSWNFELTATPLSQNEILLTSELETGLWKMKALLNDTIDSPFGRLVFTPTSSYTERYINEPITIRKNSMAAMASALSNSIRVSLANQSSTIILLSLNDAAPRRAEDILNTLIVVYNDDLNNDKDLVAINTSNFIDERLTIIEAELGSVDSDIEVYKRQNRLTDISSETGIYLQSTNLYQQQGVNLENQLTLAQSIREYLADQSKQNELLPSNTGLSEAGIERQITEYNSMMLQRNKLSADASDRNPVVLNLNNSLDALRQTIVSSVDNLIGGLEIRIRNAREQEAQASRRISQVPTQQKYVLSVEREQKIKESLYLYLLNKREEAALSQSIQENNAKVIDTAYGSSSPISPNRQLILLIAFSFGLLLPGIILWLITALSNKVYSQKEIEESIPVPFLGNIPFSQDAKKEIIAIRQGENDRTTEALRNVRAKLNLIQSEKGRIQTIMITSYQDKEGKTYIAKNLAASFAFSGKKVIVIDLDFRKKKRAKTSLVGLVDYLEGKEKASNIITHSPINERLDHISTGNITPESTELLFEEKLEQLIQLLKAEYDYILLDCVSSQYTDTQIIGRFSDLTLFVVGYGKLDNRGLSKIEQIYQANPSHNMATLLNGIKFEPYRFIYENNELHPWAIWPFVRS
ncbi:AAA family ATPase [Parabacteroides sp. OttesenSCG-928-G07]|nr:AAA family ATPase [Parabacteroides sp. OttesenSCG-928-G21]MDL2278080.1 AAA family ATPase [Parabacteroides sp. OttesenSCG-928-G07]